MFIGAFGTFWHNPSDEHRVYHGLGSVLFWPIPARFPDLPQNRPQIFLIYKQYWLQNE
jgi:hypothetical protein